MWDKIRAKQPRVSTADSGHAGDGITANRWFQPRGQHATGLPTPKAAPSWGWKSATRVPTRLGPASQCVSKWNNEAVGMGKRHLVDGGYLCMEDIVEAHQQGVELFVPSKPARNPQNRGQELTPKPSDSEAIQAWKQRMGSEEGKKIYLQRAATSETANAELRTHRGLAPLTVRGLNKIKCVALWCALAYNLTHFSKALLS